MAITNYLDLGPTAQIAFTQYKSGKITLNVLNSLVSKGKITQAELDFIIAGDV
jgi:hypothetical protein